MWQPWWNPSNSGLLYFKGQVPITVKIFILLMWQPWRDPPLPSSHSHPPPDSSIMYRPYSKETENLKLVTKLINQNGFKVPSVDLDN